MAKYRRLRLLSYLVIAYMLMAFSWWSVLLFTKNKDAFLAKSELLRIGMAAEELYQGEAHFRQTTPFQNLAAKYRRQEWMILGEALVFIITLIIGVWFINRGYKKEMEAAQQRRNFLLSITHELKSPIASIRLILDTFGKRQLRPEQSEKLVNSGLQEAERLHQLVNNLLLSARLETAFQPVFEFIDLPVLLNQVITQMQGKYPGAKIVAQIPSDLPGIQADQDGLISILTNLIENAIKYSEDPAEIYFSCQNQVLDFYFEVADKGIGISDSEKKRIFTQFYRIGNEDTRKTKGTGLGLYIVDQIVKAHRGKIKVQDNSPKGSIFSVQLPWHQ
ncbi:MAG: GHKL domain-containing protein [Saprospiraceae bacterium]|nr:GHKL domain-containing protein [Saprospiraceae bacterium]